MNFYSDVIAKDQRFHLTAPNRDVCLLEPVTRAAVAAIIQDALAAGIDLIVTETYRSTERQMMLFSQGATKLRDVGVHHYGLAADFAKRINGDVSWAGDWSFLRNLAGKYGLVSGLDWGHPELKHTFVDPDHVQRCTIEEQERLFAGEWYPDADGSGTISV